MGVGIVAGELLSVQGGAETAAMHLKQDSRNLKPVDIYCNCLLHLIYLSSVCMGAIAHM